MAYVNPDFKTKKAFLLALKGGAQLRPFNPGLGGPITNGTVDIEGPHYPKPHTWYAQVEVVNGIIVKAR